MDQNQQNLERRKENIASIEPLISAMRTISLSQWRMALNRQEKLAEFLHEVQSARSLLRQNTNIGYAQPNRTGAVLIILGSNRGLCGNFNKRLRQFAENSGILEKHFQRVIMCGKQLIGVFVDHDNWPVVQMDFPDLASIPQAMGLFNLNPPQILEKTEISVLFNDYQGASRHRTVHEQIYPNRDFQPAESTLEGLEPILDSDPVSMTLHLERLLLSARLQNCLLSSMASEHSTRFALMENADQNVENLVDELEIILQEHRKGKITTETQELAVASGLLSVD